MRRLAIALVPLFLFACDREPVAPDVAPELAGALPASAGPVFQVADESGDDTEALLAAFALAQAAGKGAVVELLPGTFEIGMIEVKEFFGTLIGAGKGISIITNLPDIVPDEVIADGKLPALIAFIGGEVTVSNLTVQLSEGLESWLGTQEMNMLLFSDYAADFTPAKQYIRVRLNDIEVGGLLQPDVELWPEGPVVDFPYYLFNGVKFSMDKQIADATVMPRCNIDATVTNSSVSNFSRGVYTWGCKSGSFRFGTEGGNTFTGNNQGLVVNENVGIRVTIVNNEFTIPDWYWNGVDLNTGEEMFAPLPLESVNGDLGIYEVRGNVFNIHYSNGMGIMDAWRYAHPEHPSWMKITWENNTFNAMADGAWMGITFNLKNALFSDNTVAGDVGSGALLSLGLPWIPPEDPNYALSWSEGCKFLNNHFLLPYFWYLLEFDTKDYLTMGDLSNLVVEDYGVDNRFIGKTNYGHSNEKLQQELARRLERMRAMYRR